MDISDEWLSVHLPDSWITSVWLTMKIYPWLNEHQWCIDGDARHLVQLSTHQLHTDLTHQEQVGLTMKIYPWLNEHQWWWCKTSCSAFHSPAAHWPDSPRASQTHHENLPLTHHERQWRVPPWWCETSYSACLSPTWLTKSKSDSPWIGTADSPWTSVTTSTSMVMWDILLSLPLTNLTHQEHVWLTIKHWWQWVPLWWCEWSWSAFL